MPIWRSLAILLMAVSCACRSTPDEQRIRGAITAMQSALEERRPRDAMQWVADDFTGADGSLDRDSLHNLLRAQVLGNARIGVALGPLEIDVREQRATVRFTATLTGGDQRWVPQRGAIYAITSGWRSIGGEWRCINAQWEQQF